LIYDFIVMLYWLYVFKVGHVESRFCNPLSFNSYLSKPHHYYLTKHHHQGGFIGAVRHLREGAYIHIYIYIDIYIHVYKYIYL
jgi:hypothetical protein